MHRGVLRQPDTTEPLKGVRSAALCSNSRRHEIGKRAGPLRNQRMLDEGKPDLVVAFPGGGGTKDMVRRAVKAGVSVHEVNRTDDW